MGAWDIHAFDNDDAADFVWDLLDHPEPRKLMEQVFALAKQADYLEAPDGSQMVALAALVATTYGVQQNLSPELDMWVEENKALLHEFAPQARAALARVQAPESELQELWAEADSEEEWRADLAKLAAALP